jgi:rod shape-determining protein MreC
VGTQANSPLNRRRTTLRRAVVAGVAVLFVGMFTVYARESPSGPLHGVQDVAGSVVTPLQDGASRAVQPLRDLWAWGTELSDARERAEALERENQVLRSQIIEGGFAREERARIEAIRGIGDDWRADYRQVPATVIGKSPSPWYERARLSVGSSDGVVRNSPVIAAGDTRAGLAGIITAVGPNNSIVTFLSEPRTSVGVTVFGAEGAVGTLQPSAPGQFTITGIPRESPVADGQPVLTGGFGQLRLRSVYPRGIPVGLVTGAGRRSIDVEQTVQVTPFVDFKSLVYVVVLAPESAAARRRAVTP